MDTFFQHLLLPGKMIIKRTPRNPGSMLNITYPHTLESLFQKQKKRFLYNLLPCIIHRFINK